MNSFEWLLIGHLVGDFLLQNNWMAMNKKNNIFALIVHSIVYTTTLYMFSLPFGGIGLTAVTILFFSHVILDKRLLVEWWLENINRTPDVFWLQVVVDQTFHLLVLVLIISI
ncbi:MAG: DUF3307 domain-containing protein [Firmicutes bacterium]|nr:DUF3307 domain-containing protein [Bacillota bacterium]